VYFSHTQWVEGRWTAPVGKTLYAVGDVHGHSAELAALHAVIRGEIDRHAEMSHSVIHLGDYIDRGPDSKGVLDILCGGIGRPVEQVFLLGNHDQFLIELIEMNPSLDARFVESWFDNGGADTMLSLGVCGYGAFLADDDVASLRLQVLAALGPRLVDFLRRLSLCHRSGEYLFVHAGIDPSVPLELQEFSDLLMIRKPFLGAADRWRQPFCVVHGHSIELPRLHPHRIGVDAGCFVNGVLCAVQLRGRSVRFLAVTPEPDFPWDLVMGGEDDFWQWAPPQQVWSADAALPAVIDSGFGFDGLPTLPNLPAVIADVAPTESLLAAPLTRVGLFTGRRRS
jgi:serine/threonine protein phosphatase 1